MAHKKAMNALKAEKAVIGIYLFAYSRARECPNRGSPNRRRRYSNSRPGYIYISHFWDIEDQEDLIRDLAHIPLIHLLIQEEEEIQRREADTVEEVEVLEEITRERKVPAAKDHKVIQGPDLQLAINNVSHHHLNEKGSN